MAALNAYTGAYQITRDEDAAFNYGIVAKLLESEKAPEQNSGSGTSDDTGGDDRQSEKSESEDESDNEADKAPEGDGNEGRGGKPGEEEKNDENSQGARNGGETPKQGNWSNAGNTQPLQSDPGGTRGSNGSVPLSGQERMELDEQLGRLSDLQKERNLFLRPDGKAESR